MFSRSTRNAIDVASRRTYICASCLRRARRIPLGVEPAHTRNNIRFLQTESQSSSPNTSFRKALKDAAKQQKKDKKESRSSKPQHDPRLEKWELTVGIEIHAELNTARKLLSSAATSISAPPNIHAAIFDVALPGTQPQFQQATLIPALRAALALNCAVQRRSSFDRKHYFYQDQPQGYQITQYYEPFARDGHVILHEHDFPYGTAPRDCPITIGIKQVQMEQDTAKTLHEPPSTHLLDFNRVSHPLVEIITLPQIHDPSVAAACVRKIQNTLKSVDACITGMEMGGLRADVNVSVRERKGASSSNHSYAGVTGLGQRTEIKNLASFKAVEDAIIAERDRQIDILEQGGRIEGETRGWTLGNKTTRRLRGKEGEIDYRYMPDPDIAPVIIGEDVVEYLRETLPRLPSSQHDLLVQSYGLSSKDAMTIISLDDGERLEYFYEVVSELQISLNMHGEEDQMKLGRTVGNWVLMELGSLFQDSEWSSTLVSTNALSSIIHSLYQRKITSWTAKQVLAQSFNGDTRAPEQIIAEDFNTPPLTKSQYVELIQELVDENPKMVKDIVEKGRTGKIGWFVGQIIAQSPQGSVEPEIAEQQAKEVMGLQKS